MMETQSETLAIEERIRQINDNKTFGRENLKTYRNSKQVIPTERIKKKKKHLLIDPILPIQHVKKSQKLHYA